jgi:hypothetical protein
MDVARDSSVLVVARPPVPRTRRLRHLIRTFVSERPSIYLPFARRKYPGPSPEVIGPDTELVIDGYTRSASTFAVYAFQSAQQRPVRMAHHLHAPAQLIAAAKRGIPALAVIREPEGAILSQLIREPDVDMRDALIAYARFYSCLLPYRSSFVVGEYLETTRDFGAIVRRLNERFGTTFGVFEHTEASVRACFELIQDRPSLSKVLLGFESGTVSLAELRADRERSPREGSSSATRGFPTDLWIPSAHRDEDKASLLTRWLDPGVARLRSRAQDAYERFVADMANGSVEVRTPP